MLTGDNPETATAVVAAQAGVDDVRAGLLPADKVAAVVGPAASATAPSPWSATASTTLPPWPPPTLGIAMGAAGTDAALETADIALMGDDLGQLPETIRLGAAHDARHLAEHRVLHRRSRAVFLVLAPLGLVSLWLAVFADMGTSLLVTANGLRLYPPLSGDNPRRTRRARRNL